MNKVTSIELNPKEIYNLAKAGKWEDFNWGEIPSAFPSLRFWETLYYKGEEEDNGDTLFHLMAKSNRADLINKILKKDGTSEEQRNSHNYDWRFLRLQNNKGISPLDILITTGQITKIPRCVFNKTFLKDIWCKDKSGEEKPLIIHLLKFVKKIPWVSEEITTSDINEMWYDNKQYLLEYLIKNLKDHFWVIEKLTPEVLISKKYGHIIPIHEITKAGFLTKLPKELLTAEVVYATDAENRNLLHYCMHYEKKGLHLIPKEFLKKKYLEQKDSQGVTPFQMIISETYNNTRKNWEYHCNLHKIPEDLVTQDRLLANHKNDHHSILDNLLDVLEKQNELGENRKEELKTILSKLSIGTLDALTKERKDQSIVQHIKTTLTKKIITKEKVKEEEITI